MTMSDRIAEIRARQNAAFGESRPDDCMIRNMMDDEGCATCIAYVDAPADIAWLLAEVQRLEKMIGRSITGK